MDAAVTRDHLARLFAEEAAVLGRLETLLETEHALLASRDVDGLDAAGRERQGGIGTLLRVQSERNSFCRMLGFEEGAVGLGKLLAWCDPEGRLRVRWEDCAARAGRCRTLNDRNGVLANAQLRRVSNFLGALTGAPKQPATYSPSATAASLPTGRLLAAKA
ncbi:MAG: hypothetical protein CMLOHMNK_00702 [Steroidobacteraceae bacterium]|nr:hypothetical protein [Steroidobacteraceae bacterium]